MDLRPIRTGGRRLAVIVLVGWLAACGGGGGTAGDTPSPSESPTPSPSPVVLTLTRLAGDGQTAAPGTAVAVPPEVVLRDDGGQPVAGVAVRFEVEQGGGSVASADAATDADGRASCGAWTLGAAKGPNRLAARVEGVAAVSFMATAAVVSEGVGVSILAPVDTQIVGDAVTVAAAVASTFQIAAVTASVDGNAVALAPGTFGRQGVPAWTGVLPLAGLPAGLHVVVVTARDVFDASTDAVVSVKLDRPPVLTVLSPLDGTVAHTRIDVAVSCSDDDAAGGCAALDATVGGTTFAGTNAIAASIDLAPFEGQRVVVDISATDSSGQTTRTSREVYVESSPLLVQRAEAPGRVWDALDTRVLYLDKTGALPSLELLDLSTGSTSTLETDAGLGGPIAAYGYLGPSSAIYLRGTDSPPGPAIFEWRAGALSQIASMDSTTDFKVAGRWAIYDRVAYGVRELVRRDLADGSVTFVARGVANVGNDVAHNGDVVFRSNYRVYRWREGATLPASGTTPGLWYVDPLTDGLQVVYLVSTPCCANQTFHPAQFDVEHGVETPLTPPTGFQQAPGTGYAVAGGHIAYQALDGSNTPQVWRRSPTGTEQLSFFGSASRIDAIGTDGTVLFSNGSKRYQATPGAALRQVGSSLGTVVVRDGRFVVLLGRSVFDLLP